MRTPRIHHWKSLAVLFAGSVASVHGCHCNRDPLSGLEYNCVARGGRPTPGDNVCQAEERFVKNLCQPARCDAGDMAPNCCPGMFCMPDGNCVVAPSRIDACERDEQCKAGQRCLDRPRVSTETKTCGFPPLDDKGGCPDGGQPFNQRCVTGTPCGGGCDTGKVCNVDTNKCDDRPTSRPGFEDGCGQECASGQMLVYANPDLMLFDGCCEVRCECAVVPAIDPGAFGSYMDVALGADRLYVSGYNSTYGDLMLGTFTRATLLPEQSEYVDGVPTDSAPTGNPNGPRGGREAPGANVGRHTSIALQGDEPRIAYYDVDGRTLKYAAYDAASASFRLSLIDDGQSEPGAPAAGGTRSSPRATVPS